MAKPIQIKDASLENKIRCIGYMFFGELSEVETKVLVQIISSAENGQLNITADVSKTITKALNLNASSFSVSIHRLVKKRAIGKQNSVITLSPILAILNQENDFIIRFVPSPMLEP